MGNVIGAYMVGEGISVQVMHCTRAEERRRSGGGERKRERGADWRRDVTRRNTGRRPDAGEGVRLNRYPDEDGPGRSTLDPRDRTPASCDSTEVTDGILPDGGPRPERRG